MFGYAPGTVTKKTHPEERQVGKVCELASGYQGSVGAWRQFDNSDRFTDEEVKKIVKKWREGNRAIVSFWWDLEDAARDTIQTGCNQYVGDHLMLGMDGAFMFMEAPNGKRIWYANPELVLAQPAWCVPAEDELCAMGVCGHDPTLQVRYMSWKAGGWRHTHTYGGKLAENACQFVSREILRAAQSNVLEDMPDTGRLVLSVYDELVAELPEGAWSIEEMVNVMEERQQWYSDWPLRADGWEGRRYKK